jgi:hypothetical protein
VKNLRLVLATLAIGAAATWAMYAIACDKDKTTATRASAASAKGASSSDCPMHASAAAAGCPDHGGAGVSGASFVTASTKGAKAAGDDGCCMAKGAKSASVTAAHECTHADGAAMAGVASCDGQGMTAGMCEDMHGKCDACADMAQTDAELMEGGTDVQAVPIKNGVMFIYSTSKPGQVSAIQSVMARRTEHLNRLVNSGDKVKLCPECRSMRGAMASGKVTREVVNIEGGALTLLTSNDPAMVKKIRAIADHTMAARVKS